MSSLPNVRRDETSAAFFDAAARGQLLMQRGLSGTVLPPEARIDPASGSPDLEPVAVSGEGVLISWAVVHRAPSPLLAEAVPYVTAVVELTEGPWLFVRLLTDDPGTLRAGQPVVARFVAAGDETVPVFTPRP